MSEISFLRLRGLNHWLVNFVDFQRGLWTVGENMTKSGRMEQPWNYAQAARGPVMTLSQDIMSADCFVCGVCACGCARVRGGEDNVDVLFVFVCMYMCVILMCNACAVCLSSYTCTCGVYRREQISGSSVCTETCVCVYVHTHTHTHTKHTCIHSRLGNLSACGHGISNT